MDPPNLSPINKFQKWVLDQEISDNEIEKAKIDFGVIDKIKDPEKKLETLKNLILYDPMDFDSLADKYLPVVNSIWEEIKADFKKFSETIQLKTILLKALLSYILVSDSDQSFWEYVFKHSKQLIIKGDQSEDLYAQI